MGNPKQVVGGLAVGRFRGPATHTQLLNRAQAAQSTVRAECGCGEALYRCSLRAAQSQQEMTNALIRQAISAHQAKTGCAEETRVFVDVAQGEAVAPGGVADPGSQPFLNRHQRRHARATRGR